METATAVISIIVTIIATGLAVGVTLFAQNRSAAEQNKAAHDAIGNNIKNTAKVLDLKFEERFEAANKRDRKRAIAMLLDAE